MYTGAVMHDSYLHDTASGDEHLEYSLWVLRSDFISIHEEYILLIACRLWHC